MGLSKYTTTSRVTSSLTQFLLSAICKHITAVGDQICKMRWGRLQHHLQFVQFYYSKACPSIHHVIFSAAIFSSQLS
uniref:Uncharacterized protein n=1 Tax=Glossina morsitans morsitans TaxID=37546 RepID=A0A1B0G1K8_GLOMM